MPLDFPITVESQEQLDRLVGDRLGRARAKWDEEHESAVEDARATERAAWYARIVDRDARARLSEMGVTDAAKQSRIIKLANLDAVKAADSGEPDPQAIDAAFKTLHAELPEVFPSDAVVREPAADTSTRRENEPLTREVVEKMSPQEINSNWERVKVWLSGPQEA